MGNRYRFSADISAKHRSVTGSNIYVAVHHPYGEIKFLVDCGLFQGEEDCDIKNNAAFTYNPENIDFILLTHNHCDHSGRIPKLYRDGFYGRMHTTKDTKKMLPIAWEDNCKILELNAAKNKAKPMYTVKHVEYALGNVVEHDFEESFEPYPNVKVTFFKNGHLIGAAIILVQIACEGYEDLNLLFTGDYKKHNNFFETSALPKEVTSLPVHIICESTYGSTDSTQSEQKVFIDNIVNWLDNGMKTVLVPALSLGRFQEVAYELKCAQDTGKLDVNIPIYFDGNMGIKYSNMFKYSFDILPEMKDFMPQNASYVEKPKRCEIINSQNQQIIVTTSGMACYGPAQEYIPSLITREDVGIHFTSFVAPTTMGYKLLTSSKETLISIGSVIKKRCAEITNTSEFSSHAKRDELLEFLNQFDNICTLFINHGEEDVKEDFAKYCKQNLENCKEVAMLGTGFTIRVDPWKIVKSIYEKE